MAKTNYTVARVQTRTKESIGKYERHNERKNDHYANKNVDLSQTEKTYILNPAVILRITKLWIRWLLTERYHFVD